jgi:TatD DNase family protein
MFTDSHCHLASHRFDPAEIPEIIARAHAAGVTRMVTLATSLDDVSTHLELASHPSVHACIGIHPCEVHQAPDDAVARLAPLAADPRVCAIGETGLDAFHPAPEGWSTEHFLDRQRVFLHRHFELATESGLPVVIHTRDRQGHATLEEALDIYRQYHDRTRAIFHCFVAPWDMARRILDLGGLVSFGGVATFKNARIVQETIRQCPAGSFLLETDSPYLAPEPHRGQRNEPTFTALVAAFIAKLRHETLEELARHTETAANCFFRFRSAPPNIPTP